MEQSTFIEGLSVERLSTDRALGASYNAIMLLICALLFSSLAAASDRCGSLERIAIAARLVGELYPALRVENMRVALSDGPYGNSGVGPTDALNFGIQIDEPISQPSNKSSNSSNGRNMDERGIPESPLYLSFDFLAFSPSSDASEVVCRPVHFLNNRDTKLLETIKAIINAHPEWSDDEVLSAARQNGIRFGPSDKTALLKLVPLKALSTFYGSLRVKDVNFRTTLEHDKKATYSFAALQWEIVAEELGTPRTLHILVEPVKGMIIGLSEFDQRSIRH